MEDETPWLTDEEAAAWVALTALLTNLPPEIDRQLKRDAGMNFFEYSILVGLARAPERSMQLSSVAVIASGSLSRLSHAITRMEKQGWVRRRACPGAGARATEAVLTEAGMAALEAAAPGHVREARRLVIDALTPEQLKQLSEIARSVVERSAPSCVPVIDEAVEGRRPR